MQRRDLPFSLFLLLLAALVSLGCPSGGEPEAETPPRDGVFVHISHGAEDAHRVLMGLQMARLMSDDKDVAVYLDIDAIQIALKDAPDLEMEPFPSSRTQIAALIDKGVPVMACPGCLRAAGKTTDDLAQGIRVADKETFFAFSSGRILTIDY